VARRQPRRQRAQPRARRLARALVELGRAWRLEPARLRLHARGLGSALDLTDAEAELARDLLDRGARRERLPGGAALGRARQRRLDQVRAGVRDDVRDVDRLRADEDASGPVDHDLGEAHALVGVEQLEPVRTPLCAPAARRSASRAWRSRCRRRRARRPAAAARRAPLRAARRRRGRRRARCAASRSPARSAGARSRPGARAASRSARTGAVGSPRPARPAARRAGTRRARARRARAGRRSA